MPKRYLEIRKEIVHKINSGEWAVGYKLPREIELCEIYDVGRTTVRRALAPLVEEGKLRRVKGTGTYVSRPQIFDQTTFFVQSFAEELRSRNLTCVTEVLECRMIPVTDEAAANALGVPLRTRVFRLRRLRYSKELLESGPITLTTSYFPEYVGRILEQYDFESVSLYRAMRQSKLIRTHCEKTISATRLPIKECRMLSAEEEDLFLTVSTVSYDSENHPMEYCQSVYPVDRNTFRLHVVTD